MTDTHEQNELLRLRQESAALRGVVSRLTAREHELLTALRLYGRHHPRCMYPINVCTCKFANYVPHPEPPEDVL